MPYSPEQPKSEADEILYNEKGRVKDPETARIMAEIEDEHRSKKQFGILKPLQKQVAFVGCPIL